MAYWCFSDGHKPYGRFIAKKNGQWISDVIGDYEVYGFLNAEEYRIFYDSLDDLLNSVSHSEELLPLIKIIENYEKTN